MPGGGNTLLITTFPCGWDGAHPTDEEPEARKVRVSFARSQPGPGRVGVQTQFGLGPKAKLFPLPLPVKVKEHGGFSKTQKLTIVSQWGSCPVYRSIFPEEFCSVLESCCGFVYLREILLLFPLPADSLCLHYLEGCCLHLFSGGRSSQ